MVCKDYICAFYKGSGCRKPYDEGAAMVQAAGARCVYARNRSACSKGISCMSCVNIKCLKQVLDNIEQELQREPIEEDLPFEMGGIREIETAASAEDLPYAYVDGSFNEREKRYGYGGIFVINGEKHIISGSNTNPETAAIRNIAGELLGAMNAVRIAKKFHVKKFKLYYDFLGIENWVTGKWSAKNILAQKYREYMTTCGIEIIFEHTKGHSGIEGNEEADQIAKKAVGLC